MLGKYFADQATQLMDDFIAEQGLISKDFEKWSHQDVRSEDPS